MRIPRLLLLDQRLEIHRTVADPHNATQNTKRKLCDNRASVSDLLRNIIVELTNSMLSSSSARINMHFGTETLIENTFVGNALLAKIQTTLLDGGVQTATKDVRHDYM